MQAAFYITPRRAILLVCLSLLTACRIEITAPMGGHVETVSGAYTCSSGDTCVVDVEDFEFAEDFVADPWDGWLFMGWMQGQRQLCGHAGKVCSLSTIGFEEYDALAAIVQSQEEFYLEPQFIQGTPIDQALAGIGDEQLRSCLLEQIERYESAEDRSLQYAEQLTRLQCDGGSDDRIYLEGIEVFTGLEQLRLVNFAESATIDLQPLGQLVRLQALELVANPGGKTFGDLSSLAGPLAELTQLEHLGLSRNDITDLSPLTGAFEGLTKLRFLDLGGNSIVDIRPLNGLTQLHSLSLLGNSSLSDISPVAGLRKLRSLNVGDTAVSDISPLSGLRRMKFLNLERAEVSDISALAGMSQLKFLYLAENSVSDISSLAGLTQLQQVDLYGNTISDINALAGLPELRSLELSENEISDISSLAGLTALRSLDIEGNEISDINSLDALTKLQHLNLRQNLVSDISSLQNLHLENVDLEHNQVSDLSPLGQTKSIERLNLAHNRISDIGPLKQHYPAPGDPQFHVDLDLSWNQISTVGDELDGIASGAVDLSGNPLTCEEAAELVADPGEPEVTYFPLPEDNFPLPLDCL
jgi:internalin A